MSWLTSYCPRCQGMLIVPATFVGHSVVCDKCGVTFVALAPVQPQYMAPVPPPVIAPPLPSQAPAGYGYGAPPYPPSGYSQPQGYSQPTGYPPAGFVHSPQPSPQVNSRLPPAEAPPQPHGGLPNAAPHPFGNPLPEIEILPPPKAKKPSSRKRSSEGKRSRRRAASGGAMPAAPSRLPKPQSSSSSGERPSGERISHTAIAQADHGSTGEISDIELRIRRAQLRRTISLAFAVIGLLIMLVVGLLVVTFVRKPPGTQPPAAPAPEPSGEASTSPTPAAQPTK